MSICIAWSHDFFGARATYTLNKVDFLSEVRSHFPTRRYLWSVNQCFFCKFVRLSHSTTRRQLISGTLQGKHLSENCLKGPLSKKIPGPMMNSLDLRPSLKRNHPISQYIQILGFWASGRFLVEVSALKRLLKYFKCLFLFVFFVFENIYCYIRKKHW